MTKEAVRLEIQERLDAERSSVERNKVGQFATPSTLARQVTEYVLSLVPQGKPLKILEPSCGSGAFISAALDLLGTSKASITGIEIDERFVAAARELWSDRAEIVSADYLRWLTDSEELFDLLIANPPYVRHHHLNGSQKDAWNDLAADAGGVLVSRLAGLYVYFILASQFRLAPGAFATWLVPSEFMATNYGRALREFLASRVRLVRIHTFSARDGQFDDALVTSCVVTYQNVLPSNKEHPRLTVGSSYEIPSASVEVDVADLRSEEKWLRLFPDAYREAIPIFRIGDLLQVRRGIATGANKFFIGTRRDFLEAGITEQFMRPILPSPRDLQLDSVDAELDGWPKLQSQLALLDCSLSLDELARQDAALHARFSSPPEALLTGYLTSKRTPWYRQERREPAPILCTYMGRGGSNGKPFRFIRNRSRATVTNSYLGLYPTPQFSAIVTDEGAALDCVWQALTEISGDTLADSGREYGGGLRKIEPKELTRLPADRLIALLDERGLLRGTLHDATDIAALATGQLTLV